MSYIIKIINKSECNRFVSDWSLLPSVVRTPDEAKHFKNEELAEDYITYELNSTTSPNGEYRVYSYTP